MIVIRWFFFSYFLLYLLVTTVVLRKSYGMNFYSSLLLQKHQSGQATISIYHCMQVLNMIITHWYWMLFRFGIILGGSSTFEVFVSLLKLYIAQTLFSHELAAKLEVSIKIVFCLFFNNMKQFPTSTLFFDPSADKATFLSPIVNSTTFLPFMQ